MGKTKTEEITVSPIAVVYGELVVKGKRKLSDVPEKIRDQVKKYLTDAGREDLTTEQGRVPVM